jgi:hypothetical protein
MNRDRFTPPYWLEHFQRNKEGRAEPDWSTPIKLSPPVAAALVRSLEQFELGDGGGPASLIAWNSEKFRSSTEECRQLVDLWFKEEKEHSRLLGKAVARLGGKKIEGHWSFSAFCLCRRFFGVRFELTVLLLTEIVSTAYYRIMRRHADDEPIRAMCSLILRDEAGHVAFHRARLARAGREEGAEYGVLWEMRFRLLGYAAGTMLWINHAPGLKPLGAQTSEFYSEITLELTRFIRKLRNEATIKKAKPFLPEIPEPLFPPSSKTAQPSAISA